MCALAFVTYCFVTTFVNAKHLKYIHMIKKRDGYLYDPSDIHYDNNAIILKITIISFIAGMLGGIVGIGGGLILAPLFLELGMPPVVVAGTN